MSPKDFEIYPKRLWWTKGSPSIKLAESPIHSKWQCHYIRKVRSFASVLLVKQLFLTQLEINQQPKTKGQGERNSIINFTLISSMSLCLPENVLRLWTSVYNIVIPGQDNGDFVAPAASKTHAFSFKIGIHKTENDQKWLNTNLPNLSFVRRLLSCRIQDYLTSKNKFHFL